MIHFVPIVEDVFSVEPDNNTQWQSPNSYAQKLLYMLGFEHEAIFNRTYDFNNWNFHNVDINSNE